MKFLLFLSHVSRAAPGRVGQYSLNHEFNRHLFEGKPLEVDPFDPKSVERFNLIVQKQMEYGAKVFPRPPRLEMVVLVDPPEEVASAPIEEALPLEEPPEEQPIAEPEPLPEPQVVTEPPRKKAGRKQAVAFPPLTPAMQS